MTIAKWDRKWSCLHLQSPCVSTSTPALDCTASLSGNKPCTSMAKAELCGFHHLCAKISHYSSPVLGQTGELPGPQVAPGKGPALVVTLSLPHLGQVLEAPTRWGHPKTSKGSLGWKKSQLIWKSTDQPRAQFQAFRECTLTNMHNKHAFSGTKIKMHTKLQALQNP